MSLQESVGLGGLIKEPIVVDGRPISRTVIAVQNSKDAIGIRAAHVLAALRLPLSYAPEVVLAFKLMWRARAYGVTKTRPVYLCYAIYIVARAKGNTEGLPEKLVSSGLMRWSTKPASFVFHAVTAAREAGIPVNKVRNERALLRAVDSLGLDRSYYSATLKLAGTFNCGASPRTKFAVALYHLTRGRLSQSRIASAFELNALTLRSGYQRAKERGEIP